MTRISIKFTGLLLLCMLISWEIHATGLSDAFSDWDPGIMQGTIMEVGKDYIVVSERRINIIDTTIKGGSVKTLIKNLNGSKMDRDDLVKGKIILAKGTIGIDDRTKSEALFATEIYILTHRFKQNEADQYKGLMDKPVPPK
jgi:hypothetical protein